MCVYICIYVLCIYIYFLFCFKPLPFLLWYREVRNVPSLDIFLTATFIKTVAIKSRRKSFSGHWSHSACNHQKCAMSAEEPLFKKAFAFILVPVNTDGTGEPRTPIRLALFPLGDFQSLQPATAPNPVNKDNKDAWWLYHSSWSTCNADDLQHFIDKREILARFSVP